MSGELRLFKIEPDGEKVPTEVRKVNFSGQGLDEQSVIQERDIQQWIDEHPAILGDDLLIIAKEYGGSIVRVRGQI